MRLLFIAFNLLLPALAFAAGDGSGAGHHDGPPMGPIGIHAINFVLLFGLLAFLLRNPIKDALASRAAGIRKELDEATTARKAAQDRFDEIEARMARFENLVEEMKVEGKADAEREAATIAEKAQRDAEYIATSAERTVREETRKAQNALQQQAVTLAVQMAEETLRASTNHDDERRLAADFLNTLNAQAVTHA